MGMRQEGMHWSQFLSSQGPELLLGGRHSDGHCYPLQQLMGTSVPLPGLQTHDAPMATKAGTWQRSEDVLPPDRAH